jgi:hypothetical protein
MNKQYTVEELLMHPRGEEALTMLLKQWCRVDKSLPAHHQLSKMGKKLKVVGTVFTAAPLLNYLKREYPLTLTKKSKLSRLERELVTSMFVQYGDLVIKLDHQVQKSSKEN